MLSWWPLPISNVRKLHYNCKVFHFCCILALVELCGLLSVFVVWFGSSFQHHGFHFHNYAGKYGSQGQNTKPVEFLKLILVSNQPNQVITAYKQFQSFNVGWMRGILVCDNSPLSVGMVESATRCPQLQLPLPQQETFEMEIEPSPSCLLASILQHWSRWRDLMCLSQSCVFVEICVSELKLQGWPFGPLLFCNFGQVQEAWCVCMGLMHLYSA